MDLGPGSRFRAQAHAHAHNMTKDPSFGWICSLSAKRLYTATARPSRFLYHEYAHILTPNHGHDDIENVVRDRCWASVSLTRTWMVY